MKCRTYVLSLMQDASSLPRREKIAEVLSKQHFNWEFFPAVDARGKSLSELGSVFDIWQFESIYKRAPAPAEIGCALSHMELLSKVALQKEELALILEDDALIDKELPVFLKLLDFGGFPRDSVLVLGQVKTKEKNSWSDILRYPLFGTRKIGGIKVGRSMYANLCGTVAYLLSKHGAEKLLSQSSQQKPFHLADDWQRKAATGLPIYFSRPLLVLEDLNFESTIETKRRISQKDKSKFTHKNRAKMVAQGIPFLGSSLIRIYEVMLWGIRFMKQMFLAK